MPRVQGSCHCGAIRFEAPEPTEITVCNCSYCDRVGGLWAYCAPDEFMLSSASDPLPDYRFSDEVVAHHHCATCGCATHSEMPSMTDGKIDFTHMRVCWNVRMAPAFDRSNVPVRQVDGRDW